MLILWIDATNVNFNQWVKIRIFKIVRRGRCKVLILRMLDWELMDTRY